MFGWSPTCGPESLGFLTQSLDLTVPATRPQNGLLAEAQRPVCGPAPLNKKAPHRGHSSFPFLLPEKQPPAPFPPKCLNINYAFSLIHIFISICPTPAVFQTPGGPETRGERDANRKLRDQFQQRLLCAETRRGSGPQRSQQPVRWGCRAVGGLLSGRTASLSPGEEAVSMPRWVSL